jgi:DHH family
MNTLNQKLLDYCNRFKSDKSEQDKNYKKLDSFYTSLNLSNYKNELPYLFEIESFCLRLYKALIKQEKICIYADYDTDACTAAAVMYHGLIDLGFKNDLIKFYTPDRFTEGYGMNTEAVANLANSFDLIISVDCGINSTLEADLILNTNCDLIITDHHHLTDQIPRAVSVCNPRLSTLYLENRDLLLQRDQIALTYKNVKQELETVIDSKKLQYLLTWSQNLQKLALESKKDLSGDFVSASVTGVGVAWFCLVWFGYFLWDLEENNNSN